MTTIVNVHLVEQGKIATLLRSRQSIHVKQTHVDQTEFVSLQVSNCVYNIIQIRNHYYIWHLKANGHWCFCNDGKNGFSCNELADEVFSNPLCRPDSCLNGGRCLPMNNSIICACKPNYYGPKCQFKLNNLTAKETCLTNVCKNNGICKLRNGNGKLFNKYKLLVFFFISRNNYSISSGLWV